MHEFRDKVTEWCFTKSPNDLGIFRRISLKLLRRILCFISNMASVSYNVALFIQSQTYTYNLALRSTLLALYL